VAADVELPLETSQNKGHVEIGSGIQLVCTHRGMPVPGNDKNRKELFCKILTLLQLCE
jgi:hypothetical protein